MRKILAIAALAAATVAGVAVTTSAAQAATVTWTIDATYTVDAPGGAPIRSGPGKAFPVVGWAEPGTTFVGAVQGNWVDMGNDNWVWLGKVSVD